jgi:hypothetical protein
LSEIIPNSFQTPNLYIDRLFPLITDQEKAVLVYAVRRIFGWNKRAERISISDFSSGIGSGRSSVLRSTSSLVSFRVLVVLAENDGKNQGRLYGLELDEKKIDWQGLGLRQKREGESEFERTEKAREAAQKERSVGQTAAGQTDRPLSSKKGPSVNIKNAPFHQSFKHKVIDSESEESSRSRPPVRVHRNPQFIEKDDRSLYPGSPAQMKFFARLGNNFAAKGRRRPERFPTLEAKEEFRQEEERLGAGLEEAVKVGLGKGILSVTGLIDFIQAWGKGGGKTKTSIPSRFQAIARSLRSGGDDPELPAPEEEHGDKK